MLVLSRRLTEKLLIGDDIEITVIGIMGNQVRLAISAPSDVTVDREEIYLRKKEGIPDTRSPGHESKERSYKPMPKPPVARLNRADLHSRIFGSNNKNQQ